MLVLSRKRDEQIVIDGDIVITIVDVRGDKVRIGIQAPPQVPVHRAEVYQALKAAEQAAAANKTPAASTDANSSIDGRSAAPGVDACQSSIVAATAISTGLVPKTGASLSAALPAALAPLVVDELDSREPASPRRPR